MQTPEPLTQLRQRLEVHPRAWKKYEERALRDLTVATVPQHRPMLIHGRWVQPQRWCGFYSLPHIKSYPYSGGQTERIAVIGEDAPEWMADILKEVNETTGGDFNSILVNIYPNGESVVSRHADKEITDDGGVYAISFGQKREMRFRPKDNSKVKLFDLDLNSGEGVWMKTVAFQEMFTHELVRRSARVAPNVRVSLTFRKF